MALIQINLDPTAKQLRWFGLSVLAFFGVIGGVVLWRAGSLTAPVVLWTIGVVLFVIYYAVRPVRRSLYVLWMRMFSPVGWVLSHLVLAVTYYLVLTPIGLIMRLAGKDPMARRFDPAASTYWIDHETGADAKRYFRQF